MPLTYIALLQLQREIYRLPRSMTRFCEYLRVLLNEDRSDVDFLPLVIVNPMARAHVPKLVDELLAIDADGVGAAGMREAFKQLGPLDLDYRVSLVVADDYGGAWTNRAAYEYQLRRLIPNPRRPWITCVLWSSEQACEETVRQMVLAAIYRTAFIHEHGAPQTLRELLAQEGVVLARAGFDRPFLDDEDVAYTREVIEPFLDRNEMRSAVECLLGDEAALSLGFTPRGLSRWAGLALALHDAQGRKFFATDKHSR